MASTRLERIGSIYTRVEGLLRSKAMKPENRPIWWDIYRAFPPTREPLFASTPRQNDNITPIFYKEDIIRAKYHKSGEPSGTVNLSDSLKKSNSQKFIEIYNNLKANSNEDKDVLFDKALDVLNQERNIKKDEWIEKNTQRFEKKTFSSETAQSKNERSKSIQDIFD